MRAISLLLALFFTAPALRAQDFYDDTVLRTVQLDFADADWWNQLKQNYDTGIYILADMTVDGVVHSGVGVRIRGNTSYKKLPQNSQKVSFAVLVDYTDPDESVYGAYTLNFNNGFTDPTFCREVAYFNFISRYIPNGRGNHIKLVCNGQNWGVYANLEKYNKGMLSQHFDDEDGVRIKCPNTPGGPALRYLGSDPSDYQPAYELNDDGGMANPWQVLIDASNAISNEPLATWENIDDVFAVDAAMWTLACESLFTDDDSYINKGADFNVYYDPEHGRLHLHQHDGNEGFRIWNQGPLYNKNDSSKPVINRLWQIPELQQRYLAHLRTMLKEFDWTLLGPVLLGYRTMLDAEVQADNKKLYPYQMFYDNFTQTVNLGGGGPGGGSLIGLQEFVDQRRAYLLGHNVLNQIVPVINSLNLTDSSPLPGELVTLTANVDGSGAPVASVTLYWRSSAGRYASEIMFDDGAHGDGAAGDGVWGVDVPVAGIAGETVDYYVSARSASGPGAMIFEPELSEMAPLQFSYQYGAGGVKITEYMYSGVDGEFVELTNLSGSSIDLTGWSLDDQSNIPGTYDLSAAGVLADGQSLVITDGLATIFAAAWGMSSSGILGGNIVCPFGRNDQINVYDASGALVERLTYGDEDFPGTVRAKSASANVCNGALGADDITAWSLSLAGDVWGSVISAGADQGNPGTHVTVTCSGIGTSYCDSNPNSSGSVALLAASGSAVVADNALTLQVDSLPLSKFGYMLMSNTQGFVGLFGGSQGNLCLGGSIVRFSKNVLNSGAAGSISFSPDLTALPQGTVISPGTQWNFQFWFRDNNPGATSNTSNGLAVKFL
jgi:hypothetical protein